MVKTMSDNVSSSSVDETKKQHKKQAKREAKAMLAVEQAKQDVQRAEQKVAKFQARLEARVARLRTLEAKLGRMRTSPQEPETGTSGGGVDGHQEQSEPAQETVNAHASEEPGSASPVNTASPTDQEAVGADSEGSQAYTMIEEDEASSGAPVPASSVNTAPTTDQEVSLPPAEGRADISQAQETTSSSEQMREGALDTENNFQGGSDSGNETTRAYNTGDSGANSEETGTQEGLGSATWQAGQRLTLTEKEREWQPEEDASQDTGTGD